MKAHVVFYSQFATTRPCPDMAMPIIKMVTTSYSLASDKLQEIHTSLLRDLAAGRLSSLERMENFIGFSGEDPMGRKFYGFTGIISEELKGAETNDSS